LKGPPKWGFGGILAEGLRYLVECNDRRSMSFGEKMVQML